MKKTICGTLIFFVLSGSIVYLGSLMVRGGSTSTLQASIKHNNSPDSPSKNFEPHEGMSETDLLSTSWGRPDRIKYSESQKAKVYTWVSKNSDGMIFASRNAYVQGGKVTKTELVKISI